MTSPAGLPGEGADTHDCPKQGCGARIPFEQMACRPHWFALPPDLRRRVWVAWRRGGIEGVLTVRREVEAVLNAHPEHRGRTVVSEKWSAFFDPDEVGDCEIADFEGYEFEDCDLPCQYVLERGSDNLRVCTKHKDALKAAGVLR